MVFLIFLLLLWQSAAKPILASDRNIFGLHLTQPSDIAQAKEIINSSGGQWGWVTITIRQDQLNTSTWQNFFDQCRRDHLIPIVRLATSMQPGSWRQPQKSDIDSMSIFLASLNWPSNQKHIILFNEINHASEWGGSIDIKGFTNIAIYATQKFKSLDPNFYILSPGLDLAAPAKLPQYQSAANVYREIYLYNPDYFKNIDAIASHSYPNHGYIGLPSDEGQHSIHGYDWELAYLKTLGVSQTYPIFITETGWPHQEGETANNQYYSADTAATYLTQAFAQWSADSRIVAVTPFIFNYPYAPFDHFSWLQKDNKLYPSYQQIIDIPKSTNHPDQTTNYEIISHSLPFIILSDQPYQGTIVLKNTGQSIWGETNFCLANQSSDNVKTTPLCTSSSVIEPNQTESFSFTFQITSSSTTTSSFLAWENSTPIAIKPVNLLINNAAIYHPAGNIFSNLKNFFTTLILLH